jgi:hypothetical protein
MEGGKGLICALFKGIKKALGIYIYMKSWGLVGGASGWCVKGQMSDVNYEVH